MTRIRSLISLLGICAAVVFSALSLQSNPESVSGATQAPTVAARGETVRIFISVRDKQGRAVRDLTPQDVQILEKGQPLKIEKLGLAPLAVGLLLDTSSSRRGALPGAEREPAATLLASVLQGSNTALVVGFDVRPTVFAAPTQNLSALESAVQTATSRFRAASALFQALEFSATGLLTDQSTARILLVVSDCDDNASKLSLRQAVEALQRTKTRVYAVVIRPPDVESPSWRRFERTAKDLTRPTGGIAFPATKPEDISAAFRKIGEDLQGLYSLEFRPASPAGDDRLHKVRVEVHRKGLFVSAPQGYFPSKN